MSLTQQDAQSLFHRAIADLGAGRLDEARRAADTLAASNFANAHVWLLQATTCRAQSDAAAEEAALDRLLAAEPRSVRGLVMKGDCRAAAGDERAAAGYYRAAVMIGGEGQPPPALQDLRRAEAALAQFKARYTERLEASLAAQGLGPNNRSARFQQSLDIAAGRKQVYFQEPTGYFFPELPQIQFYEREVFAWAGAIEAATDAIRQEILAYRTKGDTGFRPYIQGGVNEPRIDENPLLDNVDWSTLFLCENGAIAEDVVARCPRTWAAVQAAPLPRVDGAGPTVMFSLLRPGARINPHTGVFNARLTCHLPLIVPPNCHFRVGNETRQWEVGKLMVFDDTIEHEAWNGSGEDRIVLIFDIWRPELSERERREIAAVLSFR